MYYKNVLLLASQSASRKHLLTQACIPFSVIAQHADEQACNWNLPLNEVVTHIAEHKMNSVVLPLPKRTGEYIYVLTADTLSQDVNGTLNGKPVDRADAIEKIKVARAGARIATAFCLDKKIWNGVEWKIEKRIQQVVCANYVFAVPDAWINFYLDNSTGMQASCAITVEDLGAQFLQVVEGSYSTIIGLPMFELRQALETIGFFSNVPLD